MSTVERSERSVGRPSTWFIALLGVVSLITLSLLSLRIYRVRDAVTRLEQEQIQLLASEWRIWNYRIAIERPIGLFQQVTVNFYEPTYTDERFLEIVENLKRIPDIQTVFLTSTHVSDKTLEALSAIETIERLTLDGTDITDDGIKHLHKLPKLRSVGLSNTAITDEAKSDLVRRFPRLQIMDD